MHALNQNEDQLLAGRAVAIMVAGGFEEIEMTEPQRALLKAGATLKIISPDQGVVNGWHEKGWGHFFPVDRHINSVLGSDFDMLVLPGGERSVLKLQDNPHTKRIVGHFLEAGKPIAAIGQGVSLLTTSGKLKNRRISGAASAQDRVEAAGGVWDESGLVTDGVMITTVGGEDLSAFVAEMLRVFGTASEIQEAA